jgi:hypothetical protein
MSYRCSGVDSIWPWMSELFMQQVFGSARGDMLIYMPLQPLLQNDQYQM